MAPVKVLVFRGLRCSERHNAGARELKLCPRPHLFTLLSHTPPVVCEKEVIWLLFFLSHPSFAYGVANLSSSVP
jgi:hypothetical protein